MIMLTSVTCARLQAMMALSLLVTLLVFEMAYGFHAHHHRSLAFQRGTAATTTVSLLFHDDTQNHRDHIQRDRHVLSYKDFEDCDEDDHADQCSTALLWEQAGDMAAFGLPSKPSPDLSAEHVVSAIVRGLQYNDIPTNNTGVVRCYEFMDLMCKKGVTGYGNIPEERTLDFFLPHAMSSPKLRPFIGCESVVMGNVSYIPGTQTRGTIATCPVKVVPTDDPVLHDSGFVRDAIRLHAPEQTFMFHLQQQRRPPLAGAYIVTNIVNVAAQKHWFQTPMSTSSDVDETPKMENQKKQQEEESLESSTTTAAISPTTSSDNPVQADIIRINHRQQPLPQEQETFYAAKLKAIVSLEEKAFLILLDLGMVEQTPDPDAMDYDTSQDEEYAPHINISSVIPITATPTTTTVVSDCTFTTTTDSSFE
mmetsp:Transcript_23479/g.36236  ORF Transcript_23479/g.36236 Transcript_23479/m.36236 type:complete len:422 (+) Transcript_23479:196-1461(+)